MDSTQVFCPNAACPASGQVGQGNLTVHDRKKRRYRCTVCEKSFSERNGTPFYRLRTATETVVIMRKRLSHGCPLQAIVFAFGLDARTVMAWLKRGGSHCQEIHAHLVEHPRPLGEVQLDEIRFKLWHQVVGWMALALEVPTRLWLGGAVSEPRDAALWRRVVEQVKRASSALGLLLALLRERSHWLTGFYLCMVADGSAQFLYLAQSSVGWPPMVFAELTE